MSSFVRHATNEHPQLALHGLPFTHSIFPPTLGVLHNGVCIVEKLSNCCSRTVLHPKVQWEYLLRRKLRTKLPVVADIIDWDDMPLFSSVVKKACVNGARHKLQGSYGSGRNYFSQGQGKVREFCKKSGSFYILNKLQKGQGIFHEVREKWINSNYNYEKHKFHGHEYVEM